MTACPPAFMDPKRDTGRGSLGPTTFADGSRSVSSWPSLWLPVSWRLLVWERAVGTFKVRIVRDKRPTTSGLRLSASPCVYLCLSFLFLRLAREKTGHNHIRSWQDSYHYHCGVPSTDYHTHSDGGCRGNAILLYGTAPLRQLLLVVVVVVSRHHFPSRPSPFLTASW